jgi:hypothetical protein
LTGTINKADEIAVLAGSLERASNRYRQNLISVQEFEKEQTRIHTALEALKNK